eukprot:810232-Rhodomonas_salina.1
MMTEGGPAVAGRQRGGRARRRVGPCARGAAAAACRAPRTRPSPPALHAQRRAATHRHQTRQRSRWRHAL